MTQEIFLNSVPVYRTVNHEKDYIQYRLFRNDPNSTAIRFPLGANSYGHELDLVWSFIQDVIQEKELNSIVATNIFEQSQK